MAPQILGFLLGIVGLILNVSFLFIIGGIVCLILDIISLSNGKLKPTLPLFIYIGSFIYWGGWKGILIGALISNSIEAIFAVLLGFGLLTFSIFRKKPKKEKPSPLAKWYGQILSSSEDDKKFKDK